jgi:pyruvate,orthophosphate dikinase
LADDEAGRRAALDKLAARTAARIYRAIFKAMAGLPVTIRLLDPPLHEFLPHAEEEFAEVADAGGVSIDHAEAARERAA